MLLMNGVHNAVSWRELYTSLSPGMSLVPRAGLRLLSGATTSRPDPVIAEAASPQAR
jgi:hypothetical protein